MIDPRFVTTPVGAAVGVILAKRLLAKKDQSVRNLAVGGALGGGAGFLAGQYMKGDPISLSTAVDKKKALMDYYASNQPTGAPTMSELQAQEEDSPLFHIKSSNGNVWDYGGRNVLRGRAGGHAYHYKGLMRREDLAREGAAKARASGDESLAAKLDTVADAAGKAHSGMKGSVVTKAFLSGIYNGPKGALQYAADNPDLQTATFGSMSGVVSGLAKFLRKKKK